MANKFTINGIEYHFESNVPVNAIREEIKAHFPGEKWAGARKEIWSTILRGGRAENLVRFIAFSFRDVAQQALRDVDTVVNGTMDVTIEPPRRVR